MPKYSFVIPVYKAEKYLDKCINSIIDQTYTDYEIILVDDGSPDNCPKMCDEWAKKDDRISVIHKENEGASVARNTGVNAAKGEYIVFLDSDDYWYENDGLIKVDELFGEDVDIVVFPAIDYYENSGKFIPDRYNYPEEMNNLEPRERIIYMFEHDLFNVHPGKKAFRKEFLTSNDLFFKPNIRAEDVEMYAKAMNFSPVIKFLNKKLYVYNLREGSVTSTVGGEHLSEHLSIVEEYAEYKFKDKEIQDLVYSYMAYSMAIVIAHIGVIKPDNEKELDKRISKLLWMFKYKGYPRTKKIALAYRIFGYRITKKMLALYLGKGLSR